MDCVLVMYEAVFMGHHFDSFLATRGELRVYFLHVRIEALKEAIAAHQDIDIIRSLFEGGTVPNEVRADFWKVS